VTLFSQIPSLCCSCHVLEDKFIVIVFAVAAIRIKNSVCGLCMVLVKVVFSLLFYTILPSNSWLRR
jgi:hypothetical protein